MVAIDSGARASARPILNAEMTLPGIAGLATALLGFVLMASHGFGQDGIRLGSEWTWRFASLVFFVAVVAGPICRLVPLSALKGLETQRRQLIWSFCASYGVFLASLLLPNALGGVTHDETTSGMVLFCLFGGGAMAVMAWSAGSGAAERVGEKTRRALLSVAASFFWLSYALTGLAHLSGPHRPDAFYGISLSLMITALLLRFADRLVAKLRGTSAIPAP